MLPDRTPSLRDDKYRRQHLNTSHSSADYRANQIIVPSKLLPSHTTPLTYFPTDSELPNEVFMIERASFSEYFDGQYMYYFVRDEN